MAVPASISDYHKLETVIDIPSEYFSNHWCPYDETLSGGKTKIKKAQKSSNGFIDEIYQGEDDIEVSYSSESCYSCSDDTSLQSGNDGDVETDGLQTTLISSVNVVQHMTDLGKSSSVVEEIVITKSHNEISHPLEDLQSFSSAFSAQLPLNGDNLQLDSFKCGSKDDSDRNWVSLLKSRCLLKLMMSESDSNNNKKDCDPCCEQIQVSEPVKVSTYSGDLIQKNRRSADVQNINKQSSLSSREASYQIITHSQLYPDFQNPEVIFAISSSNYFYGFPQEFVIRSDRKSSIVLRKVGNNCQLSIAPHTCAAEELLLCGDAITCQYKNASNFSTSDILNNQDCVHIMFHNVNVKESVPIAVKNTKGDEFHCSNMETKNKSTCETVSKTIEAVNEVEENLKMIIGSQSFNQDLNKKSAKDTECEETHQVCIDMNYIEDNCTNEYEKKQKLDEQCPKADVQHEVDKQCFEGEHTRCSKIELSETFLQVSVNGVKIEGHSDKSYGHSEKLYKQSAKSDGPYPEADDGEYSKVNELYADDELSNEIDRRFNEHFYEVDEHFNEVDGLYSEEVVQYAEVDRKYTEIDGQHAEEVDGQYTVEVDGQYTEEVDVQYAEVDGKNTEVDGQHAEEVVGQYIEEIVGQYTEEVIEQYTEEVVGQYTEEVDRQYSEEVDGQYIEEVDGQYTEEVDEKCTEEVDGQYTKEQSKVGMLYPKNQVYSEIVQPVNINGQCSYGETFIHQNSHATDINEIFYEGHGFIFTEQNIEQHKYDVHYQEQLYCGQNATGAVTCTAGAEVSESAGAVNDVICGGREQCSQASDAVPHSLYDEYETMLQQASSSSSQHEMRLHQQPSSSSSQDHERRLQQASSSSAIMHELKCPQSSESSPSMENKTFQKTDSTDDRRVEDADGGRGRADHLLPNNGCAPAVPAAAGDSETVSSTPSDAPEDSEELLPIEVFPYTVLPPACVPADAGHGTPVVLMHLSDPSDFHVMIATPANCAAMASLVQSMNEHYQGNRDILLCSELRVGSHWAVLDKERNFWARARVLRNCLAAVQEDGAVSRKVEVQLVDVGCTATVAVGDARVLDELFTYSPPFTVHAALARVSPADCLQWGGWPDRTTSAMLQLCFDGGTLTAYFLQCGAQDERHDLVLETSDGAVINEALVKMGLACSALLETIPDQLLAADAVSTEESHEAEGTEVEVLRNAWDPMAADHGRPTNHPNYDNECLETVALGAANTDALRQCRYYSRGSTCPRGDGCPWEHSRPREDGLSCERVARYWDVSSDAVLPSEGATVLVLVTAVPSPSCFYVLMPFGACDQGSEDALIPATPSLDEMCHELEQEHANSHPMVGGELPSPGQLMVALAVLNTPQQQVGSGTTAAAFSRWSEARWYRVRVVEVMDQPTAALRQECSNESNPHEEGCVVKLFYIDIGCIRWLHERHLRNIQPAFVHMPPLAIECYLYGLSPTSSGGWTEAATETLQRLVASSVVVAAVVDVDRYKCRVGVELVLSAEGGEVENINSILVDQGLAAFWH